MPTKLNNVKTSPIISTLMALEQRDVAEKNITTAMNKGMACIGMVTAAEVQTALEMILASNLFINAARSHRLLKFLVEKAVSGTLRDTSEYNIGLQVFDRDPSLYNTTDDPIVRVQVGRLREKLKIYYTTVGVGSEIEISIPLGSYMPIILRKNAECTNCKQCYLLAISPFKCISHHIDGEHFTQGLDEALKHRLFKTMGKIIVLHPAILSGAADYGGWTLKRVTDIGISHLLEGSVQIDAENIRISIRLIKALESCVIWSEQFNRNILLTIAHQEEVAISICETLQDFFAANEGAISTTGC